MKRKGRKSVAQTPSPRKERIYGSKTNKPDSAKSKTSARTIEFSDALLKAIKRKVDAYNKGRSTNKLSLATAKAVVRRGMGAYSKSHRPTISGGMPNSRQAWGLARLNAFIKKKQGDKVKISYVQDDDLL